MKWRKIANAALIFTAVIVALPVIAAALPVIAAAVWVFNETDDE